VFKHAVLTLLVERLKHKTTPFAILDTHAGAGMYDLTSPEALKTGEAAAGVGKVIGADIAAAASYLAVVRNMNPHGLRIYPGSPGIVQALLRDRDRLIACELHDEEARRLRANFRGDARVSVHHRDGYEAINAFVPLPGRRGLVFIDPPFERRDEFGRVAEALNAALRKWPTGMFAAWYPLKQGWRAGGLRAAYDPTNPPTLCCEFRRAPLDGARLAGSGMVIANPAKASPRPS
jgi:23S rRNA (adenine2030-N6)-methyltransferase